MKISRTLKAERLEFTVKNPRILAIGDCHFPFVHVDKALYIVELAKELKPNAIVQIGDLYDMYTFSRFARSVDYITPREELMEGKKMATDFWQSLQAAAPKAKCFQLRGNHSARIEKLIQAKAPEYESLIEGPISALTEFKNVIDLKSSRSELVLNDIVFVHGWSTKPGFHMNYFGQSVVCGHSHHGGVVFKAQKTKPLFELNCGHIADDSQLPLEYGETKTTSWISGCGWYDEKGPRFINV